MKFVKWFSLFFIDAVIFFGLGFCFGFKAEDFFYPGNKPLTDYESPNIIVPESSAEPAVKQEKVLTKDTKYVVKTICLPDTEISNEVLDIPYKYIGMNRESFLVAIENMNAAPQQSEQEKGFVSAYVETFSPERVKITMYYEPLEKKLYLAIYNHQLVVFEEDMSTIYMRTGIYTDSLSEEAIIKLTNGVLIHSEQELYKLLESYSS